MATRIPLVINAGQNEQLQSGDSIDVGSSPVGGDVGGTVASTTIAASVVLSKLITGFVSGAGIVAATDTILQALNKIVGNIAAIFQTPAGVIEMYGGTTAPTGYLLCNGAAVSRSTYANLFAAIYVSKGAVTITNANPGVVLLSSHGLATGDNIELVFSGSCSGLTTNTNYFVIVKDANSFYLATTYANAIAGTKINTTGSQTGTFALNYVPYGISTASNFNTPDMRGAGAGGVGTSTLFTANETIGLGNALNDVSQGHYHNPLSGTTPTFCVKVASGSADYPGSGSTLLSEATTGAPVTDGANGTPRTAAWTKGKTIGVNFIIKT